MPTPLRFGVFGTGQWSNHSHIPGAKANEHVEFAGAIGRHDDFDEFLSRVDAVGFAVPPEVQSALALRAIRTGKHVLMEKPIALDVADAELLAATAREAGVASIVFYTKRFLPTVSAWLDSLTATGGWSYGRVEMISPWLASAASPGWRGERGGLWDLGPHAYSLLQPVLGPARRVSASRDANGLVVVTLGHDRGTGVITVTLGAAEGSGGDHTLFTGAHGRQQNPALDAETGRADAAYSRAIDALVAQLDEPGHPCDLQFGAETVRVLDAAERSIASGRTIDL
ncbi:MAG: oxidoreductase [Rhodoglobus sp.]|nr:oxidoreductase [Rhodoglobus sp.]